MNHKKICTDQFRRFVVRPVLEYLHPVIPLSEAAETLLVGTAVHESRLEFFDQWTGPGDITLGPALGFFQIERNTHEDLYKNFLRFRPALLEFVEALLVPGRDRDRQLVTNLEYATAIARVLFYRAPERLPAADDLSALAAYWKRYYNTLAGKGTAEQWLYHYRSFVEP